MSRIIQKDKPVEVTVFCLTYNHEKYIERMLESVVGQKTNFNYEVLVHDDASVDNTKAIIEKYANLYDVIVPIYQKKNQYSLNRKITYDILLPLAKGRYFAFCEGDDYWCDEYKLQKQYDTLERNSNCSLCVHKVACCNEDGSYNSRVIPESFYNLKEGEIDREEIADCLWLRGGYPFQTSSYFVRREVYSDEENFKFMYKFSLDQSIIQAGMRSGDFYYYEDIMSCYRMGSAGSWNKMFETNGIQNRITHWKKHVIERGIVYDALTNFRFHQKIEYAIVQNILSWCIYDQEEAKNIFREIDFDLNNRNEYITYIMKIRFWMLFHFPFLLKYVQITVKSMKNALKQKF